MVSRVIKELKHFSLNIIVWFIVFLVNFPLLWMFLTSIKQYNEVYLYPPVLISKSPTLNHYIELFKITNFGRYFLNSLIVTASTTLITIFVATLTTYSLTRFKIRGSGLLSRAYLLIYLIPQVVMIIPIFLIMKNFRILNSLVSLIVTYLIFTFPYCFMMLRSYMGSISRSLEEAAMIDGASRVGAFIRIVLPAAAPGIIATSIFSAILSWNEFLFALVLISSDSNKTLTLGVAGLTDRMAISSWGMLMAAGVIVVIPMLIFFIFIQKKLVFGLTAGAIKE
ncbi:MAG: carbohydrate ABC transporter permease [Spirochaetota bacterium]